MQLERALIYLNNNDSISDVTLNNSKLQRILIPFSSSNGKRSTIFNELNTSLSLIQPRVALFSELESPNVFIWRSIVVVFFICSRFSKYINNAKGSLDQ